MTGCNKSPDDEPETLHEALQNLSVAWSNFLAELRKVFEPPLVKALNFLAKMLG